MGSKPRGFDEVAEELNRRVEKELGFHVLIHWVENGDYKQKLNMKMIAEEEYNLM